MRHIPVIGLALLLLVHSTCGHREGPNHPAPDTGDHVRVDWIRPALSDSILADTIRVEMSVSGEGATGLVVTADDSIAGVAPSPPWCLSWLPEGPARRIRLHATVAGASAPDRMIRWSPNAPPCIEIIGIPLAGGVERSAAESLRAVATDPEDGDLDGDAIVWTSDLQGLLGYGRRIPTESLIRGHHVLRARALDRWRRGTIVARSIEAFDPADPTTPEGTIEMLRRAMLAADSSAYLLAIDTAFRFLLCPADRAADPSLPVGWELEAERSFAGRIGGVAGAGWSLASLQREGIDGEEWAKGEINDLTFAFVRGPSTGKEVRGGRARVYLRRAPGASAWKFVQWNDLGAEGPSYGRVRLEIVDDDGSLKSCNQDHSINKLSTVRG